ncbi:MAG TPA: hypothetical protein VKD90_22220 [Gemmataceae bacterium]|nr:hypothetical protein [Gemmataceae bacterium]
MRVTLERVEPRKSEGRLVMADETKRDPDTPDLTAMFGILARDMQETAAALKADPSQYHRRVAVRGLFALVEAVTYMLKQQILIWIAKGNKRYTFEEIALQKEETYALDRRARPTVQAKFLPTDDNFRFAVNLYTRDYEPKHILDVGDNGGNQFQQALHIRNRITHPKSPKLLDVSDEEMRVVEGAYGWFMHSVVILMVRSAEDLTMRVARLHGPARDGS